MKKRTKILLGSLTVLVLGIGLFALLNWESIDIVLGTEDLAADAQVIPEPIEIPADLQLTGPTDWPCWRGRAGDGRTLTTNIIKDWSNGLNQLWTVDFLCQGRASAAWSAPVVQGDRLIITGRDHGKDVIFCLYTPTGELLWKKEYQAATGSSHGEGMRATATIEDDRVYTFGRGGNMVCWNLLTGDIIWQDSVTGHGGQEPSWGHSSSPLIVGNRVIVQAGGQARVIAFDKMAGTVAWKSGTGDAGYATLVATELEGAPLLLAFHGHGLAALDPNTGTEAWDIPWETSYRVNATTPLVADNTIFITSGYRTGGQLLTVKEGQPQALWTNTVIASHHSDGVIIDGYLYSYTGQSTQNKGTFKCVELSTGTERWASKEIGWGTCMEIDEHLICLDLKGNLFLIKPDPDKLIKVTEMPKALGDVSPAWTLPVVANGNLYLRFKQRLICYRLVEPSN